MPSRLGSPAHDLHAEQPPLGNTYMPGVLLRGFKRKRCASNGCICASETVTHPKSAPLLEAVLERGAVPRDGEHPLGSIPRLARPLGLARGCSGGQSPAGWGMGEVRRCETGAGEPSLRGWTSKGGVSVGVRDWIWGSGVAPSRWRQGGKQQRCHYATGRLRIRHGLVLLWQVPMEKVKVEQPPIQRDSSAPGSRVPGNSVPGAGGLVAVAICRLPSWWPPSVRWGITGFSDNPGLIPQP